jgi:hypothetical protein
VSRGVWLGGRWFASPLFTVALIPSYAQDPAGLAASGPDKAYDLAANWILEQDPTLQAWAAELIAKYRFTALYPRLLTALNQASRQCFRKIRRYH